MDDKEVQIVVELTRDEKIDELLNMREDIKSVIELLRNVEAALKVFVKVGNAVKWVAGLFTAVGAVYYFFKMGSHK